ncbi:2-hydroxyacid dehydrogenase [Bacillus yapensis]|nr:2-hydroxyacid dehydrogenase [Bacillus yapensis]
MGLNRKKVLCLDSISKRMEILIMEQLSKEIDIVFCKDKKDWEKHIRTANVLITFTHGISKEWIEKADDCVFIQKLGAGINNIDLVEASKRKIPVANAPGLNSTAVAEHSVILMLSVFKHLVTAHNYIVHKGEWLKTQLRDHSYQLSYKKVGLIGFGNIGREVCRLLKGFECEISYYDTYRLSNEKEAELGVSYKNLDKLIQESDVVSLHVPLNSGTYHLVNKERLLLMKETAVLINTCRGGVIDEDALYDVLKSGRLTGAGLDVFETEPIEKDNKLASLPNVILTPHIGGGTNEAMEAVIQKACLNINSVLSNGKLPNEKDIVNFNELQSCSI